MRADTDSVCFGSDVFTVGNQKYNSYTYTKEALRALAAACRHKTLEDVLDSLLRGIILDESTDISVISQLLTFYRIVKDGRAKVMFAGVDSLKSGGAEMVTNTMLHRLGKDEIRSPSGV